MPTDENGSARALAPDSAKLPPGTRPQRSMWQVIRSIDRYGLVLGLLIVTYIADAMLNSSAAGRVIIVALQGSTLALVLQTSGVRWFWTRLAWLYVGLAVLLAIGEEVIQPAHATPRLVPAAGGVLLFIAPFVILRRIVRHTRVSSQTILGAVSVYILIGECFAYLFQFTSVLQAAPFFTTLSTARLTDYLFFSFTTITTVGYGNLVPASEIGQAFAMLEALTGQIYLVVVVARLVSIWAPRNDQPPA